MKLVEGGIYTLPEDLTAVNGIVIHKGKWKYSGFYPMNQPCDYCHKCRKYTHEFLYPETPMNDRYGEWNGFQGGIDEPLRLGSECVKKVLKPVS
jgi:hypothetical protein